MNSPGTDISRTGDGPCIHNSPSTMNFRKSVPIALRQGIMVPQYGDRLRIEKTRGTMKRASRARTSKAISTRT